MSDSAIDRALDGDSQAWSHVCEIFGPIVYVQARKQGLQADDAADIVQNVFMAVAKNTHKYVRGQNSGNFAAWIHVIARNKIHDHFRQLKRGIPAVGGTTANHQLVQVPSSNGGAHAIEEKMELSDFKRRLIDHIRPEFDQGVWESFWRTSVGAESPDDVAREIGVTVWAVYKARARVTARLKEIFSGDV